MRLLHTYAASLRVQRSGFTLIELLIVMALLITVTSAGFVYLIRSMPQSVIAHERDLLLALLYETRMRALINAHGEPQGVYIDTDAFFLFEGNTFKEGEPTTIRIPRTASVSISGDDTLSFENNTENVVEEKTLRLSLGDLEEVITINNEGRIDF